MPTNRDVTKKPWVDPDDAPELTKEWFEKATLMQGDKVVRRGGRPKLDNPKDLVTIRLDHDLVTRLRAGGKGWQSRVNAILREHLAREE